MTSDNLKHLETLDPPYFENHEDIISEHKMSALFGETCGNHTPFDN